MNVNLQTVESTPGSAERSATEASGDRPATCDLTVVCPFYNEAAIIEHAVTTLLDRLREMDVSWELIVVNDGSTDGAGDIVRSLADKEAGLTLISYPHNRGRGYALRQGIAAARGDVIVTTEIDLSWGEDIVDRLYKEMLAHPEADLVVASPHLPGGGYRNVPAKRVFLSQFGNKIIRACMSGAATMNTGMTRAYRREMIQSIPLEEDRKEFHLDVIVKARALKYRIHEIPCVLEWKAYKQEGRTVQRKSSSKVNKLVVTHTLFSLFANPIRYVWTLSALGAFGSAFFFCWGLVLLARGELSIFSAIVSLSFAIIALLFFTFGVIAQQGFMIQKELWSLKQDMARQRRAKSKE